MSDDRPLFTSLEKGTGEYCELNEIRHCEFLTHFSKRLSKRLSFITQILLVKISFEKSCSFFYLRKNLLFFHCCCFIPFSCFSFLLFPRHLSVVSLFWFYFVTKVSLAYFSFWLSKIDFVNNYCKFQICPRQNVSVFVEKHTRRSCLHLFRRIAGLEDLARFSIFIDIYMYI